MEDNGQAFLVRPAFTPETKKAVQGPEANGASQPLLRGVTELASGWVQ